MNKLCRPILIETKNNEDRQYPCILKTSFMFDNPRGELGYYDCTLRCANIAMILYIISLDPNEEIEEGDLYLSKHNVEGKILSDKMILSRADKNFMLNHYIPNDGYRFKVIALSNKLSPEYIQQYIKEYNEDNVKDILVEYEEIETFFIEHQFSGSALKLINNFITIHPIQDDYKLLTKHSIKPNKNNWKFERSSGYAGYRNIFTTEWIYQKDYDKLFDPITYTEGEVYNLCIDAYEAGHDEGGSNVAGPCMSDQCSSEEWFETNKKK